MKRANVELRWRKEAIGDNDPYNQTGLTKVYGFVPGYGQKELFVLQYRAVDDPDDLHKAEWRDVPIEGQEEA